MIPSDYILTPEGDLKIQNGDFVIGDATTDNQRLLLMAEKGEWKHAPLAGVGLRSYIDDEKPEEMLREVRRQFTRDGMKVKQLEYVGGKLKFESPYV